jgi:hypothetical protein
MRVATEQRARMTAWHRIGFCLFVGIMVIATIWGN